MDSSLLILVIPAFLGLIPASIAANKGRTFFLWWIYGAALFIIALPHSLITKGNAKVMEEKQLTNGMRKCPSCAELVKEEAVVCRFCQRDLPPVEMKPQLHIGGRDVEIVKMMDEYGITFDGSNYYRKGKPYATLDYAVKTAKHVLATSATS
jgi:hypothetical protein